MRAVQVPVFMDAGAGYGEAINVWHTIREMEATGIAESYASRTRSIQNMAPTTATTWST